MAGYVIGVGVLAFAFWQVYSHRTPDGAIEFSGTITEEVARRSRQTGRRTLVYAPRVAYRHPGTGRDEVYEPSRFDRNRFTAGDQTPLVFDPANERIFRPLDRPIRDTVMLGLVGVGFIAAQFFDR